MPHLSWNRVSYGFLAVLVAAALMAPSAAAQTLTSAAVSDRTVTLGGSDLFNVLSVKVGSEILTNLQATSDGTGITGSLSAVLEPGEYTVELKLVATWNNCSTGKPGDDWICVNGGWVPPTHPNVTDAAIKLTTTLTVGQAPPKAPVSFGVYDADGKFIAPLIMSSDSGYSYSTHQARAALLDDGKWHTAAINKKGWAPSVSGLWYLDAACAQAGYFYVSNGDLFEADLWVGSRDATVGYVTEETMIRVAAGTSYWYKQFGTDVCQGPYVEEGYDFDFYPTRAVSLPTFKVPALENRETDLVIRAISSK